MPSNKRDSTRTGTRKSLAEVRYFASLLKILKAEKLRVDHWREKEATRDAVPLTIRDFLWSEETGLPGRYSTVASLN